MDFTIDLGVASRGRHVWIMVHADNRLQGWPEKAEELSVPAAYVEDGFAER
jgi:hypothetical protein